MRMLPAHRTLAATAAALAVGSAAVAARAQGVPLDDGALSDVWGQALLTMTNTSVNGYDFSRITLGADIDFNANFTNVQLGGYSYSARNGTGYDIDVGTLRFGRSDGTEAQRLVHVTDPYFEFVYQNASSTDASQRNVVGMRLGFGSIQGDIGIQMNAVSGSLLIDAGSSGIGTTAIQLAKALGIAVYTTAGTNEKCRWCESLGAARAVNYKKEDFELAFRDTGIDVILDMTGGDFTPKNLRLLREDGRLIYINAMRGREATIDIPRIMSKRLTITGSMLKPRDAAFKSALAADIEKQVWPLIARGALRPLIHASFPLTRAADAQQLMETNTHRGKILLLVS